MKTLILKFAREENGNAVIDWVVLMAGMVMMAIAATTTIDEETDKISDGTLERMESIEVGAL